MPASAKRPARVKREMADTQIGSSPSRPSKRQKVKKPDESHNARSQIKARRREDLALDDDALVKKVTAYLDLPAEHIQAAADHSNSLHQEKKTGISAYAQLGGKDWTFYIQRLRIKIGRPPEGSSHNDSATSNQGDQDSEHKIHVDLGPSKMISRQHAEIAFDHDRWTIRVLGRNGLRLDGSPTRRGECRNLRSGQVIEIAGIEMMFVLPFGEVDAVVDPQYLRKAGLIVDDSDTQELEGSPTGPLGAHMGDSRPSSSLPVASAPQEYRRPGTPTSSRARVPGSSRKSPAFANGGMLTMNGDDVDLSLESNKHIKPAFSYAQMISQAILDSENEKVTLAGIYGFITNRYSYYRHQAPAGWQNSIRHNLSLSAKFDKVPRATDEPGKGMKWCILPEYRDQMVKECVRSGRGGHRGSSAAPSSPNGLGYLARAAKDVDPDTGAAQTVKRSPISGSPPAFPPNVPQLTPDRGGQMPVLQEPGDGSPLPRHRRTNASNTYGMSDNIPGSPPVLSSSYQQEDSNSFVTPAPHRVHPRLAPPSTAQRPSQHMPTSSPAPFWKFADIGSTPLRPGFDMSPIKGSRLGNPPSSSPPPARQAAAASPSRNGVPVKLEMPEVEEVEEEETAFDLTVGFQSIGSFHAPPPSVPSRSS